VGPRTVGLNKRSVWRLQGLLGSLMSTCIAAEAAERRCRLTGNQLISSQRSFMTGS
jgi:hypothetical protein